MSTAHGGADDPEMSGNVGPGREPTPVTVLSGALGAGKTTLLRYVLEQPHGFRVAVIQNEFSEEMGMEGPLITDANGEAFKDIVELPNGCLCCSAKDGLISALDALLEERRRFDYVLVEATGVADPESICEIFWVDEELGSKVYLDGVVTLVDCQNAPDMLAAAAARVPESAGDAHGSAAGSLGLHAESAKQVACADVLVLNKVDLVPDAAARGRLRARLLEINPTAALLESTRAAVPLGDILGIRAFGRQRLEASLAHLNTSAVCAHASLPDDCALCAGYGAAGTGHAKGRRRVQGFCSGYSGYPQQRVGLLVAPSHGIESFLLRGDSATACYDEAKINAWLAAVLWEGVAGNVYRCKGLFRGPEGNGLALQGVGKIFEVEDVPQALCEVRENKLLFIGRNIDRAELAEGLRRCAIAGTEPADVA